MPALGSPGPPYSVAPTVRLLPAGSSETEAWPITEWSAPHASATEAGENTDTIATVQRSAMSTGRRSATMIMAPSGELLVLLT
jgi:hypothetical protein